MSRKNKLYGSTLFFLTIISYFSCGFAYQQHLTGNYYIIGVDSNKELLLSYKLGNGDFVGKAPGQILEYGFNDTFLVAKTREGLTSDPLLYIINMTKDYDLALEEKYREGPVSQMDYDKVWKSRLNVILEKVQK